MLKASADNNIIRKQDETSVISYVSSNPSGRKLAYNYMEANWKGLTERHGSTSFTLPSLIDTLTRRLSSAEDLKQVQDFMKNNSDLGVSYDSFVQAIENININIKWLDSNLKSIDTWLKDNQ